MPLLQRIIEHLQKLVLVSDISLMLMAVAIIIMSVAYGYSIFSKKNNYENIIVKLGILVRILMIIGFTIEFSHQKAIYQGDPIMDGKFRAMDQFSNYLFYGYIFVIGLYDIFTIGLNKFRGFFHAFDLTIISMPILYGITILIFNFQLNKDFLMAAILLASLLILPYLFFNLYWKENLKWFSIFLGYTGLLSIYYKTSIIESLFTLTAISYLLLGAYELGRIIFNKARVKAPAKLWNRLKVISIILPLILIFSSIITLNISPLEIEKKYEVESFYKEDATFTTMEGAEKLARIALEDQTSPIAHWQGKSEDFNNRYMFSLGGYKVQINGATGKIFEIRREKPWDVNPKVTLSEEEIKEKTFNWLKAVGFTYDETRHDLRIEKSQEKYNVNIYNKFSDGTVDTRQSGTLQWYSDGKLEVAGIGLSFSNLRDYKQIKISDSTIVQNLEAWYNKLGEEMPPYLIDNFTYWFGDHDPYITVRCKNNDSFNINCYSGEILNFHREGKGKSLGYTEDAYNKYKEKAEAFAKSFSSNWKEASYTLEEKSQKDNLFYSFVDNSSDLKNSINIELDLDGNLKAYSQYNNFKGKLYSDKDFKVSSSTALKLVAKEYKPFGIYSRRVKLAAEIKENGEVNYKWMVVVLPFKKVEHQIFYVDATTGKVNPLINYEK